MYITDNKTAGIDIDGILGDYTTNFVNFVNLEFGTKFNPNDFNQYNIVEHMGFTKIEQDYLTWKYRTSGFKRIEPVIEDGRILLKELRKKKYEIMIITSRPAWKIGQIYPDTEFWFKSNRLPHDCILFAEDKCTLIRNTFGYVNLFVDDLTYNANMVSDCSCRSYLLNKPYNISDETLENVFRIDSLLEVLLWI